MKRYYRVSAIFSFFSLACGAAVAPQVTFHPPSFVSTLRGALAMVAGDFNGDGKQDLAVANGGSFSVSILLGKGDGTFQSPISYPVPSGCPVGFLAVADFNNDNHPDLVSACLLGTSMFVLPGNGDGTFGAPIVTTLPARALVGNALEVNFQGLTVADFDGDGKQDVAILLGSDLTSLNVSFGIYVLKGTGDGKFQTPVNLPFTAGAVAVASGDFNGDGKPDLAVLTRTQTGVAQSLVIGLGDGTGGFHAEADIPWNGGSFSVAVADVNGDGKADLVSDGAKLNTGDTQITADVVAVYLGDGKGNFTQSFQTASNDTITVAFTMASLDATGKVDIIESQVTGLNAGIVGSLLQVRPGNGDGTFQAAVPISFPAETFPFALVAADFNGDGLSDVALTGASLPTIKAVLANIGNGIVSGAQAVAAAYAVLPTGNLIEYINAATPPAQTFANVNGASFAVGAPVATDSIVSAFGTNLASGTFPSVTLGTSLGGISIDVVDSAGMSRLAPLFYVSPTQINYEIPDGTATGLATISITGNAQPFSAQLQIVSVAPGVFFAGNHVAAGNIVTVNGSMQVITGLAQTDASGNIQPSPIDVGSGSEQVFVVLYGTGIRNHVNPVTATVGTTPADVTFAGPTSQFVGEDQIDILLPQSLKGAGLVNVTLNVDGQTTNPVQILIQ